MNNVKKEIIKLRNTQKIAYLCSIDEEGFPQTKAVLVREHDNLSIQYFSTNTSSKRVQQFLKNPKASVYYCNKLLFKGALFTGIVEICTDHETKKRFWHAGDTQYYSLGIDDPDYCIIKFIAYKVNYYHGLNNITLSMEDF